GLVWLAGPLSVLRLYAQNGFTFSTFSSVAGLTLNGTAAQVGSTLRLTSAAVTPPQGQAGSVWFPTPPAWQGGFTTTFQFQLRDRYFRDAENFRARVHAYRYAQAPSELVGCGRVDWNARTTSPITTVLPRYGQRSLQCDTFIWFAEILGRG